jgi:hypothetical protein
LPWDEPQRNKYQTAPKYPNRASQEASVTYMTSNRDIVNLEGIWKARSSIMMLATRHQQPSALDKEICGLMLHLQP